MEFERLKDKVIVISGGTKGVGRAFAEVAGREGAKVVIGGRDEKAGKEAVRNIRTFGSDGIFVHCDLLKIDDCRKLFSAGYERFGKIDGFFKSKEGLIPRCSASCKLVPNIVRLGRIPRSCVAGGKCPCGI